MKKVIIIGAGPAGITAGYELLRQSKDYEVEILEEAQVVGGISRTVAHNGNRMDIGGHRFFSKDERVTKWWDRLMPMQGAPAYDDKKLGREKSLAAGGPDPERDDRVMLLRQRVSRIYYKKKFFDYPVKMNANTIKNMGFGTTMLAGFSYLGSTIIKKPEDSLENFYINRFGRKLYSMFFEGYTEKLWGRHPREISADWGAQRVKGLSILAILKDILGKAIPGNKKRKVETSLIEEFSYPKFGPGQLWETAAEEYQRMGGKLTMGAKVVALAAEGGKLRSVTYETADGERVTREADLVISSMPLKDLVTALGDAPADVQRIADGLPYRDFVTVGLLVDRLNLKNETAIKTLGSLVPDCWIYVQDTGVKLGRIQIFNNWSPYMVKDPDNSVWIGLEYFCTEGDSFWCGSDEDWRARGVRELVAMGVLDEGQPVRDFHVEKVKKAYPAYFDTYAEIDRLVDYLNSYENLYCVGRNGQHRYNNMDHSMATSFEAVKNILSGTADKSNIWSVNTEQEYHEEKETKS